VATEQQEEIAKKAFEFASQPPGRPGCPPTLIRDFEHTCALAKRRGRSNRTGKKYLASFKSLIVVAYWL
jgi:hypothetical protein